MSAPPSFFAQLLALEDREELAACHAHVAMFIFDAAAASCGRRHNSAHPRVGLANDVIDELLDCRSHAQMLGIAFPASGDESVELGDGGRSLWSHVRRSIGGGASVLPPEVLGGATPASDAVQQACAAFAIQQLTGMINVVLDGGEAGVGALGGAARGSAIIRVLRGAGLLSPEDARTGGGTGGPTRIPAASLTFAMAAPAQQWWTVLDAVLRDAGQPRSAHCSALCLLGQLRVDRAYRWPAKGAAGLGSVYALLLRLADVGLLFPFRGDGGAGGLFVVPGALAEALHYGCRPAPLGDALGPGSDAAAAAQAGEDDSIITETNFQVFAYTRNRATRALLRQFTADETEVNDNFVCCRISRDSFVDAVARGITAAQIIGFLTLKAHPVMRRGGGNPVPESIRDQLLIWEAECQRLQFVDDCVLLSFPSAAAMRAAKELLGEAGDVLCEGAHAIVVSSHVYDQLLAPRIGGSSHAAASHEQ